MADVLCPECNQTIRNAVPVGGKYRCGACKAIFAAAMPIDSLSLQSNFTDRTAQTAPHEAVVAAPEAPRPPLGRMPSPASYGLAQAVGWVMVVFAVVSLGWSMNILLNPPKIDPNAPINMFSPRPKVIPAATTWDLVVTGLAGTRDILLALLVVCAATLMTRLDKKASWLAWRSESLKDPIGEPPGSSLPFILPLCVSGGVWVYMSLSSGTAISGMLSFLAAFGIKDTGLNIIFVAIGMMVFLMGLGCGEVRRFFWRMQLFGKSLTKRKRGDELSIKVPSKYYARPDPTGSDRYMLGMLVLLLISYSVIAWQIYDAQKQMGYAMSGMRRMPGMSGDPATDSMRQIWVMMLTGFIGIVGGAYTLYRLSLLWSEMLYNWRWASNSVGLVRGSQFGEISTSRFSIVGRLAGFGVTALAAYFVCRTIGLKAVFSSPTIVSILIITIPLLLTCFIWWIAGLKRDTFAWVSATSIFSRGEPEASPLREHIRLLVTGVLLILAIQVGMIVYAVYEMVAPLGGMGGRGGMGSGVGLEALVVGIIALLVVIAFVVLPSAWIALSVRDFNRASENLDACVETQD
jgi:hypothetical protein